MGIKYVASSETQGPDNLRAAFRLEELLGGDLLLFRADDLGTHDGLVQVQNAVKLSGGLGGCGEVNNRVDALGLLLNFVC